MQIVDQQIKRNFSRQVQSDLDQILLEKRHDLSNKEFADHLYTFLNTKYDWRDWYVVVYKDIDQDPKFHKHNVTSDNAITSFGVKDRNIVITSENKTKLMASWLKIL